MKMRLILPVAVCFLFSCSQKPTSQEIHREVVHTASPELALNGTERWQADEPTTNSMELIAELMKEHAALKENNTLEAYNTLGEILDDEMQQVFKNCTMKGEAHDMLHVYLVPMVEDIKELNGENLAYAREAHKHLDIRIKEYKTYFK